MNADTLASLPAAPPTAPLASPLSALQHKRALWADAGLQVHAVLMGTRIPGLPARLAAAGLPEHHCLLPGALSPEAEQGAPQLARLAPEAPFTDWLLFEAAPAFGDWGLLLLSAARGPALRNHLRGLLQARLPGGQRIALDWMDPPVLQALLPLFAPAELATFFGPVQAFVRPGAQHWAHARLERGALVQTELALLAGGA